MKSRDEVCLEKILRYIGQIEDAHREYGNCLETFQKSSVYRTICRFLRMM